MLLERFGRQRLIACGVLTVDKNGKDFFLFNDDYPVIEVHASPAGHVVGMQFRPSPKRMLKVKAHKEWKRRWSGVVDTDGNEVPPGTVGEIAIKGPEVMIGYWRNPEATAAAFPEGRNANGGWFRSGDGGYMVLYETDDLDGRMAHIEAAVDSRTSRA
jgi:acyl-CoA synthetase (AMP-forming)/AMP-acid ligase II